MAYRSNLGYYVIATARALANGDVDMLTVSGLVMVTNIFAVVTVAGGGACNFSFGANPTTGTTVVWSVAADIDAAVVGDMITINSVAGTLTTAITGVSAAYNIVCAAGTIMGRADAALNTVQFYVSYVPLTANATIVTV